MKLGGRIGDELGILFHLWCLSGCRLLNLRSCSHGDDEHTDGKHVVECVHRVYGELCVCLTGSCTSLGFLGSAAGCLHFRRE